MSAIFSFPILKNGKSRLFLLRVSNSKVLNAERIIEFHCASGVGQFMKSGPICGTLKRILPLDISLKLILSPTATVHLVGHQVVKVPLLPR